VKRSPVATARRTVRRATTWRPKTSPDAGVDIAALISPLRYDVLVRAQLFDLVRDRPDGGAAAGEAGDDELVAQARASAYFTWFEKVAMARFRPWVLEDPALLESQFRERVLSAAALYRSFAARGFDPAHPVTLRGTKGTLASDSGLEIAKTLHVGDGGHRLALLLCAGLPLTAGTYRVDRRPMPHLIDNTAVLVPALDLAERDYVAFVAPGYGVAAADAGTTVAGLVEQVRARDLAAAEELAAVAARHLHHEGAVREVTR
jgi:hypothetical protein